MTREETEISVWTRVYHDREHMGPTTAKEHADEALRAFREAFPNSPQGDGERSSCGCAAFNAAAEATGDTRRTICNRCRRLPA